MSALSDIHNFSNVAFDGLTGKVWWSEDINSNFSLAAPSFMILQGILLSLAFVSSLIKCKWLYLNQSYFMFYTLLHFFIVGIMFINMQDNT